MMALSNKLFDFFSSFKLDPSTLQIHELSFFMICLRYLLCLKSLGQRNYEIIVCKHRTKKGKHCAWLLIQSMSHKPGI